MITPQCYLSLICPHFSANSFKLCESTPPFQWTAAFFFDRDLPLVARWIARHPSWINEYERVDRALPSQLERAEACLVCFGDRDYPERLKHISFPPPVLFYRGDLGALSDHPLAIVGSRQPTRLATLWMEHAMPAFVGAGKVIVSGGAIGVDGMAHELALRAGGRTVAFLPGGIDQLYPRQHFVLLNEAAKAGCLVTEFLPGTPVRAENFHRRNRLISGSTDMLIVIEARRRSGTLMTATRARDQGGDVRVLPGPPWVENYAGSLDLIENGADMARDPNELLKILDAKNTLKKEKESPSVEDYEKISGDR